MPETLTKNTVKECFIILPYDSRGDEVYERFLQEACEKAGFEAERADIQLTRKINEGIETSLSWAPMVCAYLGRPPAWNINVAIEVGYRLSTRRPLVLLCDEPEDGQPLNLPFDINQDRVIQLPRGDIDQRTQDRFVKKIVQTMKQRQRDRLPFASVQAVANIHYPANRFSAATAVFVEASQLATKLFGPGLVDRTLEEFYQQLKAKMPSGQYNNFMYEQALLIAQAQDAAVPVVARVPIVFREGDYRGRAYLPMIVTATDYGSVRELRVLYLDVTAVVEEVCDETDPGVTYHRCSLNTKVRPLTLDDVRPLVFLAHNSLDKERFVIPIVDLLKESGAEPWLDENNIPVGTPWVDEIGKAIENCAAAIVFLGSNGGGQFQGTEIQALVSEYVKRRGTPKAFRLVPVLLPGAKIEDFSIFLRGIHAMPYDRLKVEIPAIVDSL